MIATRWPVLLAAARTRLITSAWLEKLPWEKLSRATLTPAWINRANISGDSEAGPMVATIFVLCERKGAFMAYNSSRLLGGRQLALTWSGSRRILLSLEGED